MKKLVLIFVLGSTPVFAQNVGPAIIGTLNGTAIDNSRLNVANGVPKLDANGNITNPISTTKIAVNTSVLVPAEGGSVSALGNFGKILINPASNLNNVTLTIESDGNTLVGDSFEIGFTKNIGTLNLFQGGGTEIAVISNISAGTKISVWNAGGTLYAFSN